ncbi:hypothetical protein LZ578_12030 (plasmid) [Jeotgalibaca sp. MA1X17-3]|uniref:hypothetical protein n=1 Tax=Jeotgalibaca sp. MA1X17-3 TaxID=2908211 RepID=UPI001F372FD5|nr:hypothetical protein [Jeotgalibaca sp. MA1X17-3]UJF16788.1 hypothetical protein LZ578_12030 [Jeotgalibaca sp. MA1X17-3]
MEKRGEVSERVEQNRQIKKENYNRQKENSTTTIHVIMNPLSPKEKGELKVIAKNLKVFVNYDNLIDKERMIKNWQRTEAINKIIRPDNFDSSVIDKIEFTKENVERGKEILEKQYLRIFEKYYPELIDHHFSKYTQMNIAKRSLEVDQVLEMEEVVSILSESRDNEVKDLLKTISKNPYVKPSIEYNRAIVVATKKLDEFYKENNVHQDTVQNLSEDKKEEFKKLYSYQDLQLNTKELMSTYYNQTIFSSYPTADLSELNFGEREELSKAIHYYGNTLSYTKLVEASQEKFISKYTTYDQKIGLHFIHKLENGSFTQEDRQALESDYHQKEIFDTVSNEATKTLFLNEVDHNPDLSVDGSMEQGEGIGSSPSLLEKLAKNGHLYDNLLRASEDNARRKAEKINKKAPQAIQSVQDKKNKKTKIRTPHL